ncbi:Wzy polymerase domain-containing protein [Diaphorobacter sp.]|uniref:PglL family O-oligosaccharyltransferase n=1 Tax=Diaphorobacter sp. TaxID=1934310 RepID=UPI0028B0B312|nr:Wzy polymerase domain-containing protein [Diaphorobacter sp.]
MKAVTHAFVLSARTLAVAVPFLFAYTRSPLSNFWPLVASAVCACLIVVVSVGGVHRPRALRDALARDLALGLVLAGVLASLIGLIQFFQGDVGWSPWIYASTLGQAIGNLRQRNQQATLLLMSALALLLLVSVWLGARSHARASHADWRLSVFAAAAPWLLVLLCMGSGVTASRTAAMGWLVLVCMVWLWRRSIGRVSLWLSLAGLLAFLLCAWMLPELLYRLSGVHMDGLFSRVADTSHRCTSRLTLWSNMLYLIGQKPLWGWGWGELDFAHYSTVFPDERFCVLLDNAHNLPLHLAVELGVPVAIAFCAVVLWSIWRYKPWRETNASRQLAWGVLALVGLHSMLEFPLWYGPFQLVTALAVVILLLPTRDDASLSPGSTLVAQAVLSAACAAWLVGAYAVSSDYRRMAQLYLTQAQREPQWRDLTAREVTMTTRFFRDQAEFAWLTTTTINADNAAQMHLLAQRLMHYSPEARVITRLIESAQLLGLEEEAHEQLKLFELAYPDAYRQFMAKPPASAPGI